MSFTCIVSEMLFYLLAFQYSSVLVKDHSSKLGGTGLQNKPMCSTQRQKVESRDVTYLIPLAATRSCFLITHWTLSATILRRLPFLNFFQVTDELEQVKQQMDERGTNMTDSGKQNYTTML